MNAHSDTNLIIINAIPLLLYKDALNLKSKSMDSADMLIKIVSSSTKPPITAKSAPRDISSPVLESANGSNAKIESIMAMDNANL